MSGEVQYITYDNLYAEGLRKALTACSFRDEIILLSTTLSVLDNALQLYDMIAKLGLAHQILLASDNEVRLTTKKILNNPLTFVGMPHPQHVNMC